MTTNISDDTREEIEAIRDEYAKLPPEKRKAFLEKIALWRAEIDEVIDDLQTIKKLKDK